MLIEELQEMLDEHGIVWHEAGDITFFGNSEYGTLYAVREYETGLSLYPLTPNKVIDIAIGEVTIGDALAKMETCHAVSMDCFGNPPYNQSGLNGNDIVLGCSECGVPWSTSGIFRGNFLKHNFKACPLCGRRVV